MRIVPSPRRGTRFASVSTISLLALAAGCAAGATESSSPGPEAADPGQLIAAGAQVYGNNCARCHNARAAAEKTDVEWDLVVAHMRARANLTGAQARAVQAFLAMVNAPPAGGEVSFLTRHQRPPTRVKAYPFRERGSQARLPWTPPCTTAPSSMRTRRR